MILEEESGEKRREGKKEDGQEEKKAVKMGEEQMTEVASPQGKTPSQKIRFFSKANRQ